MKTNIYKNLEVQYNKLFRHLKVGSFKTRERYGKAVKRVMVFLAREYRMQKLCNISEKHILSYVSYMQNKGLSASTIKPELAAIRFFHDNMPYTEAKFRPMRIWISKSEPSAEWTEPGLLRNLTICSLPQLITRIIRRFCDLHDMLDFAWRNASALTPTTQKMLLILANCLSKARADFGDMYLSTNLSESHSVIC